MADLLLIGEVAARSGVAASALRFYEERGLIASERSGSGHRRFRRSVLRRIAFIVFAQQGGARRVHRVRLPVAEPVQARQPRRPARLRRPRPGQVAVRRARLTQRPVAAAAPAAISRAVTSPVRCSIPVRTYGAPKPR